MQRPRRRRRLRRPFSRRQTNNLNNQVQQCTLALAATLNAARANPAQLPTEWIVGGLEAAAVAAERYHALDMIERRRGIHNDEAQCADKSLWTPEAYHRQRMQRSRQTEYLSFLALSVFKPELMSEPPGLRDRQGGEDGVAVFVPKPAGLPQRLFQQQRDTPAAAAELELAKQWVHDHMMAVSPQVAHSASIQIVESHNHGPSQLIKAMLVPASDMTDREQRLAVCQSLAVTLAVKGGTMFPPGDPQLAAPFLRFAAGQHMLPHALVAELGR